MQSTKPSYVDNGTYGCVLRPSIPCNGTERPHTVSKVFDQEDKHQQEYETMSRILPASLKDANKKAPFFAEPLDVCKIKLETLHGAYRECTNFKWRKDGSTPKDKRLWQIIYPDGGTDVNKLLQKTGDATTFADIFLGMQSIFKGIVEIANSRIVHQDIKPSNIVYNNVSQRCLLIDFGIAVRMDDVYDIRSSRSFFTSPYRYFPTEYPLMKVLSSKDNTLVDSVLSKSKRGIDELLVNFAGSANDYGYYDFYLRGTRARFDAIITSPELQKMYHNLINHSYHHRQDQLLTMVDEVAKVAVKGTGRASQQASMSRAPPAATPVDSKDMLLIQQCVIALDEFAYDMTHEKLDSALRVLGKLYTKFPSHLTISRAYDELRKLQTEKKAPLSPTRIFEKYIIPLEEVQNQWHLEQVKQKPVKQAVKTYDYSAMHSILKNQVHKIDVYMLGVAVLEVFSQCLKLGRIGTTSESFIASFLIMLHSMTNFNVFERCTPVQAYEMYQRAVRHLRASLVFTHEEKAAIQALSTRPMAVNEQRQVKSLSAKRPRIARSSRHARGQSLQSLRRVSADEHKRILEEIQDVSNKLLQRQASDLLPSTPELLRRLDHAASEEPLRGITTEIQDRIRSLQDQRASLPPSKRRGFTASIRVLRNILKTTQSKMTLLLSTPRQKQEMEAMRASRRPHSRS